MRDMVFISLASICSQFASEVDFHESLVCCIVLVARGRPLIGFLSLKPSRYAPGLKINTKLSEIKRTTENGLSKIP